jgi:type II secretory pathway component PulM
MHHWNSLNKNEQLIAIIGSLLILLLFLYFIIISPINTTNNHLNKQYQAQIKLHHQLNLIKNKLGSTNYYLALNATKAKKIILNTLSNNNISQRNFIKIRNKGLKKITVTITKQPFNLLLNALQKLKNQYGIVVNKAKITKIKNGIVKANLTIIYP